MFNVRRDKDWLGFAVGRPEEVPGFRVGDDGLPLPAPASRPTSPSLPNAPSAGIPAPMDDLLLQTGGPIGPETMMGPQDHFVGNPYWRGESDPRSASPIVPTGYGFPFAPTRSPLAEGMRTTKPLRSELRPDVGEFLDATAPIATGVFDAPAADQNFGGRDASRADLMRTPNPMQYTSGGSFFARYPALPTQPWPMPEWLKKQPPQFDRSPGEVVVLPDGSTIPDPTANSSTGKVMSPVADLRKVAADGRRTGEVFRGMLDNPETSAGASPYLYLTLWRNLGHGGTYDHQRRGNMITGHVNGFTQLPQFRPIANINVGLFAQQAGMTLDEVLGIAGHFATYFSNNADDTKPYNLDPLTHHFIKRGYELGQSGMFDNPPMP